MSDKNDESVSEFLDSTRRTILLGGLFASSSLPGLANAAIKTPNKVKQDRKFLWGTATAAHQVEGNNVNCDIWLLENIPGSAFREPSGDACDHFNLYEQDIALLRRLGFNTYRFGIEWARVEPAEGRFSQAILRHYRRMLECCHRNGIIPMVTLHHFTSPIWFAAKGGFENSDAPRLFARYCSQVADALGDLMGWVCTINEANLSFFDQTKSRKEAARQTGAANFSTFLFADQSKAKPNVHLSHANARDAMKAKHPHLQIGYTLAMDDYQDAPDAPGFSAGPRSAEYDPWLIGARNDDFIGVQTYTRVVYGKSGRVAWPKEKRTQIGQEFYPPAIGGTIRYAAQVAQVPAVITENGVGIEDDALRIQYINGALGAVRSAMDDGVDIRGYVHWSLMDNFEWLAGYRPKFGLVAVDRLTMKRTPKPSAFHLGAIARKNKMPKG